MCVYSKDTDYGYRAKIQTTTMDVCGLYERKFGADYPRKQSLRDLQVKAPLVF